MGVILGIIGAIPLFILGIYGGLGTISGGFNSIIIMLISVLVTGGILGFFGAYFHKNRDKAIKEKERKGKNKKKNKK